VVSPLFFPGGDIGDLAVNGTVNDLAVSGARPLYLSAGFILEEGFPVADLQRVTESMRAAAEAAGVHVVTGDTKVVQKGKADGCYINTAGVGVIERDCALGVARASRATPSSCPGRSATTASRSCWPAASWTSRRTSAPTRPR
jgi:Hydrogenase maturation factor